MDSITIDTDGSISAIQSDLMDELNLGGVRSVPRISDIHWNINKQKWEVRPVRSEERTENPDGTVFMSRMLGPILFEHKQRKECLQWEKENEELLLTTTLSKLMS